MTPQPALPLAVAANDAPWIDTPAKGAPMPMLVKVLTSTNRRFEYQGLFRHTFDAYDDALERYPHVSRIEVQAIPPTTTGGAHGTPQARA